VPGDGGAISRIDERSLIEELAPANVEDAVTLPVSVTTMFAVSGGLHIR
jgi:hypothetical protein